MKLSGNVYKGPNLYHYCQYILYYRYNAAFKSRSGNWHFQWIHVDRRWSVTVTNAV